MLQVGEPAQRTASSTGGTPARNFCLLYERLRQRHATRSLLLRRSTQNSKFKITELLGIGEKRKQQN
ncbi:hypothetical protein FDUTEX481_03822 [Tolypothrix sp. PCC 7601]|nr:hypothetical protein FDUTEX481_03822 [Tolypothrix sp. PCC 7601]